MKYIMYRVKRASDHPDKSWYFVPFLFPMSFVHSAFDEYAFMIVRENIPFATVEKVSAGFVAYPPGSHLFAYGSSETLDLSSRPEDTEIIQKYLNGTLLVRAEVDGKEDAAT